MMKIGFVIGTLNYSGAEKVARHLIHALYHQYHHEIGLILISGEDPHPEIDYIKQFPIKTSGNKLARVYNRHAQIREIVNTEQYDVVISFGVKFNIDTIEALKSVKTKVILCERNDPISDPHRKILRIRRRISYPYASGYVFQTKEIAHFFGDEIASRSAIIPNFIERRMPKLYSSNTEDIIVHISRLDDRQKNIMMLLRAFKEFTTIHNYDYHLYIVGDGPDKRKFRQYTAENNLDDRVHFPGKQNVYDYLKFAQIYVLPSNYEGMPNSLIEAMASGIPCIATNCSGGGAAYLIEDHINGTLIPVNDKAKLVSALIELADNQELRAQYSKEAYRINDILEFNKIITKWISYIEYVVESGLSA